MSIHYPDTEHGFYLSFSLTQEFFRLHPFLLRPVNITADTPLPMVITHLAKFSGIPDLTDVLDHPQSFSEYPIARGGLADVYRLIRTDGVQLAVKCLRQQENKHVKHTARELHTWSKLKHHNILELHGLALFRNCLAMVSPWMEHGSVNCFLKTWPDKDRYTLCKQLVDAVKYLHDANVVHGDIKGDNLLVDSDGTLKLGDFGLAILHDTAMHFSMTDPGGGTLRWMAPELLIDDDSRRTQETDIYAMGMTMLEIISGNVPFHEIQAGHRVMMAVTQGRTPLVPELQTEPTSRRATKTLNILNRCWRYKPGERAKAHEVPDWMDNIDTGSEVRSPNDPGCLIS